MKETRMALQNVNKMQNEKNLFFLKIRFIYNLKPNAESRSIVKQTINLN